MKLTGKILLLAAGTAVVSSVVTAVAMQQVLAPSDEYTFSSPSADPGAGRFYTVGHSPASSTDFSRAAESTINGVVSIKSYATPRGYSNSRGGGGGFFNDPFFEYFFCLVNTSPSPRAPARYTIPAWRGKKKRGG
ncbi:MAG: hypothetical protein K2L58_04870, partial [Duncaniella sp.]|nr:hypothetical protein [Duncaniella sp.]